MVGSATCLKKCVVGSIVSRLRSRRSDIWESQPGHIKSWVIGNYFHHSSFLGIDGHLCLQIPEYTLPYHLAPFLVVPTPSSARRRFHRSGPTGAPGTPTMAHRRMNTETGHEAATSSGFMNLHHRALPRTADPTPAPGEILPGARDQRKGASKPCLPMAPSLPRRWNSTFLRKAFRSTGEIDRRMPPCTRT